jgi:RimJ/RimL family protein N-acetyltransferase
VLRPPTADDAAEWLAGEDDEIVRWFEFPRRSTQDDFLRAVQVWSEAWRTGGAVRCWAVVDTATSAIAGGVEVQRLDDRDVNLSYWVCPAWRRRGIATRAAELALVYAAANLGAARAIIKVLEDNAPSIAVARRLGAQLVGTTPSDTGATMLVFHRAILLS